MNQSTSNHDASVNQDILDKLQKSVDTHMMPQSIQQK